MARRVPYAVCAPTSRRGVNHDVPAERGGTSRRVAPFARSKPVGGLWIKIVRRFCNGRA